MKDLVNFFYEVGTLRYLSRSYILHMLQPVESVADHSHRVIIIAYLLAIKAEANPHKTMLMAAFHDLPESRTGDSNWHQKEYLAQDDEKAWEAQLRLMGNGTDELKKILKEYKERKSFESQLAKDADNIDYLLNLKELAFKGNEEAGRRLKEDNHFEIMYTGLGIKVARQVLKSKPNEWYQLDRKKTHKKYTVKKK